MKCLDDIDALVAMAENGWPIGIKTLQNLRAQIAMDVAEVRRSVELIREVASPDLVPVGDDE